MLELSYKEKETHWKHGGIVGVKGYGGGVIGRYTDMPEEFPNISLGTVYRNLNLLVELGEVQKLTFGDGKDHFDADTSLHYHFVCRSCGAVIDLPMEPLSAIDQKAQACFCFPAILR